MVAWDRPRGSLCKYAHRERDVIAEHPAQAYPEFEVLVPICQISPNDMAAAKAP
jgi:hypothetical protein